MISLYPRSSSASRTAFSVCRSARQEENRRSRVPSGVEIRKRFIAPPLLYHFIMMKSYHTQQGSVNPFFHRRGAPSPFYRLLTVNLRCSGGRAAAGDERPFCFTVSRREIFRRYSGSPLEAQIYTLPGRGMFAMTWRGQWPSSAAGECRCPPAGAKGGKGTVWFPCPLLTPPNPPLRRDSLWSRGETGVTGLGSVRRADWGTLLGPECTLRDLQRCQCAARRCRALDLRCEKLRFHQVLYLEAPDAPVASRI